MSEQEIMKLKEVIEGGRNFGSKVLINAEAFLIGMLHLRSSLSYIYADAETKTPGQKYSPAELNCITAIDKLRGVHKCFS